MNKFDPTTSTMLFQIAVDGYSSCGKSTLAKAIARELNLLYIDSGAMYRSVAYYCLSNNIDNLAANDWDRLMSEIEIKLTPSPDGNQVFLNQTDVTTAIRNPNISKIVSEVSAVSSVRRKLVEVQRSYATERPVVMDGRDIGTVVFPDAAVKLFIIADLRTRSLRRWNELRKKGIMMQVDSSFDPKLSIKQLFKNQGKFYNMNPNNIQTFNHMTKAKTSNWLRTALTKFQKKKIGP